MGLHVYPHMHEHTYDVRRLLIVYLRPSIFRWVVNEFCFKFCAVYIIVCIHVMHVITLQL